MSETVTVEGRYLALAVQPGYPDLAYQDGVLVRGRYLGNGKFLKEPNEHQAEEAAEARAQATPSYEGR